MVTYASVQGSAFRTRYKKCRGCGGTSKGISVIPRMPGKDIEHQRQTVVILREVHPTTFSGN